MLVGLTTSMSSFGRVSNSILADTDTESSKHKASDETSCTGEEWVTKPGGGMEIRTFTGLVDNCKKVSIVSTCTPHDCAKSDTDTSF